MLSGRTLGIEYFIKAVSTGEHSALSRLEPFLAADVEYHTPTQPGVPPLAYEIFKGKNAVLSRVTGQWPITFMYRRIGWSEPFQDGDGMKVITAGPVTATFRFNETDQIRYIAVEGSWLEGTPLPPVVAGEVDEIPLLAKGHINNARANETPIVVSYVDDQGVPHSSFRGSTVVIGPAEVSLWIRDAHGGLATAIATNPHVTLTYGDLRSSFETINISGRAHISTDEEIRRKAYEQTIEAEQNHDTDRKGVAVIVDVITLYAFLGGRVYTMNRS